MSTGQDEVHHALVQGGGVLRRRDHPELSGVVDRLLRDTRLVALLPGVYAPTARAAELEVRVRALVAWRPGVVLTGRVAARLTFWPELEVGAVEAAGPGLRGRPPGYEFHNRRVDPEWRTGRGALQLTVPALTAVDLCGELGGEALDTVLRSRRASLTDLHAALAATGGRRGNRRRHELLVDSRDEPWSEAEREAHRLLRAAELGGWRSNFPVLVAGARYYLDIAFPEAMLAVEIDGRCHARADAFERDRERQNALVLAGWRVLRFTWAMLTQQPGAVIAAIRHALTAVR